MQCQFRGWIYALLSVMTVTYLRAIQECIFGIHRIQHKLKWGVWTVYYSGFLYLCWVLLTHTVKRKEQIQTRYFVGFLYFCLVPHCKLLRKRKDSDAVLCWLNLSSLSYPYTEKKRKDSDTVLCWLSLFFPVHSQRMHCNLFRKENILTRYFAGFLRLHSLILTLKRKDSDTVLCWLSFFA